MKNSCLLKGRQTYRQQWQNFYKRNEAAIPGDYMDIDAGPQVSYSITNWPLLYLSNRKYGLGEMLMSDFSKRNECLLKTTKS